MATGGAAQATSPSSPTSLGLAAKKRALEDAADLASKESMSASKTVDVMLGSIGRLPGDVDSGKSMVHAAFHAGESGSKRRSRKTHGKKHRSSKSKRKKAATRQADPVKDQSPGTRPLSRSQRAGPSNRSSISRRQRSV